MRRSTVCMLGGAICLAAAGPAQAATVTHHGDTIVDSRHSLVAAPGEANDVEISAEGVDGALVVRYSDLLTPLTAGPGCDQVDGHTVACPAVSGIARSSLTLDDLDDRVRADPTVANAVNLVADLGTGDDVVDVTNEALLLQQSHDFFAAEVTGGGGDDLIAIRGSDVVVDGGGGSDSIRVIGESCCFEGPWVTVTGGAGADRIEVEGISAPNVSGGDGDDGIASSGDASGDEGDDTIECGAICFGGPGDDRVMGGSELHGETGDDRLDGGERQYGGPGADVLTGAAISAHGDGCDLPAPLCPAEPDGDDRIDLVDIVSTAGLSGQDAVCGGGDDIVRLDPRDSAAADCETVRGLLP